MPEVIVKYKDKKSLAALEDLSKYLDFKIVTTAKSKSVLGSKKIPLIKQIEEGLKEVKLIQEGKLSGKSIKEIYHGK